MWRARVESEQFPGFWHSQSSSAGCSPTPTQPQAPASVWLCSALLHFLFSCRSQQLSPSHTHKPLHVLFLSLDDSRDPSISSNGIFPPVPQAGQALLTHLKQEGSGAGRTKGRGHIQHPQCVQCGDRAVPVGARTSPWCWGHSLAHEHLNWIRIHHWSRQTLPPPPHLTCAHSVASPQSVACPLIPKNILQLKKLSPQNFCTFCFSHRTHPALGTGHGALCPARPQGPWVGWSEDPPLPLCAATGCSGISRSLLSDVGRS